MLAAVMSPEGASASSEQQQGARAELRERFLTTLYDLKGESCVILTYEKSMLEATFHSWNTDGSEILVQDMKTPARVMMDSALLRTPDVLAVQFDKTIS